MLPLCLLLCLIIGQINYAQMEFFVASESDTTTTINPLTSIDSSRNNIYLFEPETNADTKYKSFTYKINIEELTFQETKTDNFISFSLSPISSGYCQFNNFLYYMSSTYTINKIAVSDPYSIQSRAKWYLPSLSTGDWITMTCDTSRNYIYILQNNDLIIFNERIGSVDHVQIDIDLDVILMDSHSSAYHNNKLYVVHSVSNSTSKQIGIIDLQRNYQWLVSNQTVTNCYDSGLNTFARNNKIYLFCEDYIKIYDIPNNNIEITADQLNIPRYHASIQIYDLSQF